MSDVKQVQIRRRETKSYLPAEVVAGAKHRVGSVLSGQSPLVGLSEEDQDKYLPEYLGVSKNSPNYRTEVRKYWANLFLDVPQSGKELNISTDDEGNPMVFQDWITYQWLLRHPLVAENEQEFRSNPNMRFYIHDPEIELKRKNNETKVRRNAYKEFITLTTGKVDGDKVNRVVRLLMGANPSRMDDMEKENYLESIAKEEPERFLAIVKDKDLDIRAEINEMIEKGVLTKIGNSVHFVEDIIGHTMEEAIVFFKNPKESSTIGMMRQRLKEAGKTVAA